MFSNGLVKYESQFDSILKSPSRFITMGEAYMRVISLPVGERSIADTVRTKLKFSINDVLSEKVSRETIAAFSKFGDENAKEHSSPKGNVNEEARWEVSLTRQRMIRVHKKRNSFIEAVELKATNRKVAQKRS